MYTSAFLILLFSFLSALYPRRLSRWVCLSSSFCFSSLHVEVSDTLGHSVTLHYDVYKVNTHTWVWGVFDAHTALMFNAAELFLVILACLLKLTHSRRGWWSLQCLWVVTDDRHTHTTYTLAYLSDMKIFSRFYYVWYLVSVKMSEEVLDLFLF